MGDPLRDRCLPRDLAANQQVFEFSKKIGAFSRLAELVEGDLSALEAGDTLLNWREFLVTGSLGFSFADATEAAVALDMSIKATVPAVCQRCLQGFEMPLATALQLLLGEPGKDIAERDDYEFWELSEKEFSPLELVEEALIMALPLAAIHENRNDCVTLDSTQGDEDRADREMTTPFAALRAQMDDRK